MSTTDPDPNRSNSDTAAKPADQADGHADAQPDATAADADDAPTAEDTEAAAPPPRRTGARDRLRGSRMAMAAGVALVIGAVGAAGYFAVRAEQVRSREDAKEAARLAACEYAPVLADYNAQNLDTYFAAVLDGATGAWKQEFDATSKDLREVLTKGQVVSRPGEVQCAIESGDEHTARAVVVIGQSISSVGTQGQPREGQLAVTLSMQHVDGSWLVNEVSSPLLPQ
ncbi:hypothetical protein [Nocardia cyriacigeorgica]|uniref:hypothetical protein n=1 Tax=Nocardia cyriacigeorgica TaxID=135487 RepID=UPI001894580C|nr:hypothetical protein [Nocardia cyriacigeorgica]MBF6456163.1 hypothetical protein [Nocardia cyriacigeorgica]MBF6477035.1 hypothetical protein [Nocardia cyriacigeorgica]MBF6553097.1 hypothetical protein [Nocardia cyriacigeorgica]